MDKFWCPLVFDVLSFECSVSFRLTHSKVSFNNFMYGRITFYQSFQKLFSSSEINFVGWAESRETSKSEPGTFHDMNIYKQPQAPMPSSFKMEVKQISPFRLLRL